MKSTVNLALFTICVLLSGCATLNKVENEFQSDADLIRLEHLEYWTSLVEEYEEKTGYFPFQKSLESEEQIVLVKISTMQQRQYLSKGGAKYNPKFDNNGSGYFLEKGVGELVYELERVLDKSIPEKYDIQKVPVNSPVGYNYFASKDGYLIWVTCITCGVTKISTLLMDGYTPTVNIVSDGMKGKVTKALNRDEMLSHPIYKQWKGRGFNKEAYVRNVVLENESDSKQ